MKTYEELNTEIIAAQTVIDGINKQIQEKRKMTLVQCTTSVRGKGCGMAFPISELDYIQTLWYTRPHGCMGGDYWNHGEGQFVCPSCGRMNRLYDRPDIEKLKHLFKSTTDRYDER